jgi:hypothetical protein
MVIAERAKEHGAEPKTKGIREPAYLTRSPAAFFDATSLTAPQWRRVVAAAPVVRACIQTLVMQITGLKWEIQGEDDDLVEYFTLVLNGSDDGAGFENMIARVVEDALTVPFGGAWEIGSYRDGTVAWLAHLDAGLMRPTNDKNYPYAMVSPWGGPLDVALFEPGEIARVMWQPQTDVTVYGWTRTPVMDCLPAIQGLLRSDRFWQTLLTDSPPPGVLDVIGWSEEEARDWLAGWKTMMAGVDALKVPILYGREKGEAAQFISFGATATEAQLPELVKRYAELVCAAFGMNVGDLGLFGQELRLAGATKLIELSKRQGLAHLLRRIKQRIDNEVLPDGVEFAWEDVELEDTVRRETARKLSADRLATLANAFIIDPTVALAQAVEEGLITVEAGEPPAPPAPPPAPEPPTGDAAATTTGETKGEQGQRRRPFGEALQRQGEATVPRRARPTTSHSAQTLGKLVGPWIAKIAASVTRPRIAKLLDAGIAAAQAAGGIEGATAHRALTPSPAEKAIADLLANESWWHAPNIADRAAAALELAYAEGLVDQAHAIEKAMVKAGLAGKARLIPAVTKITDPAALRQLERRALGLIKNVDSGTDHFIRREIMAGVKQGLHSPEIARTVLVDDVRRGIIETFRGRALSIVNTEINWAQTQAAIAQNLSVGLTKRRWHALVAEACDICLDNMDRGAIGPDESFESVWGDCDGPPAHPNVCHCWVTFDPAELREIAGAPTYYTGQAP